VTQPNPFSALVQECDDLDRIIADLTEEQWQLDTPAPGWTIAHQVAHLAATFRMAGMAAADPDGFTALVKSLSSNFNANVTHALNQYLNDSHEVLFKRWQSERADAIKALAAVPDGQVVPWLVNPLPPAILAMAGMMEAFAHGQDIADTLGVQREYTNRIWFLVAFAVRVWDFGYLARNEQPPATEFRFELTGPSGDVRTFGPEDAEQRISGSAVDFCLLTTRRRHRVDLDIQATGPDADHWVDIAQAYRGPAGEGRMPGQFDE
jgi:uncharacterized protein (TIGR03084 family)